MIKHLLSKIGLQNKVESILTDFEVGIMAAVNNSLPKVEIRGCRFHYDRLYGDMLSMNLEKL